MPSHSAAETAPPSPVSPGNVLASLAALTTVTLWASAFVAIRHLGAEISPGPLALARLTIGSLCLGVIVLFRSRAPVGRADIAPLLACGLVWYAGYNLLLNAAEVRIDAGTAALMVNVGPVVITVLATVLLGERLHSGLVWGTTLGLSGAVVIGLEGARGSAGDLTGIALGAAAGLAYAVGVLAQKRLASRVPALQITFLACLIGMTACLPHAPALIEEVAGASPQAQLWILYLGLFPTAVAFSTWSYALANTPAGQLGATTYLIPPITIGLSLLLLDEAPTLISLAGGAVCLFGVYLTRRTSG